MLSDAERHEYERLVLMGRETLGPPSPRQTLVARTLEPGAWSEHAEEHIRWCERHGLTHSRSHFGGQFLILRRLALMRAQEILRRLDRQSEGRPDLSPLDAVTLSTRLGEQAMKLRTADPRRNVSHKAAKAVFFLKQVDGIPAPAATMGADGSVTLVWSESDRTATISIDVEGRLQLRLPPTGNSPIEIDVVTWNARPWRLVTAATDWVHHDGPEPRIDGEAQMGASRIATSTPRSLDMFGAEVGSHA